MGIFRRILHSSWGWYPRTGWWVFVLQENPLLSGKKHGKIEENHGTIEENHGKIEENQGKFGENHGKIEENNGKIEEARNQKKSKTVKKNNSKNNSAPIYIYTGQLT